MYSGFELNSKHKYSCCDKQLKKIVSTYHALSPFCHLPRVRSSPFSLSLCSESFLSFSVRIRHWSRADARRASGGTRSATNHDSMQQQATVVDIRDRLLTGLDKEYNVSPARTRPRERSPTSQTPRARRASGGTTAGPTGPRSRPNMPDTPLHKPE